MASPPSDDGPGEVADLGIAEELPEPDERALCARSCRSGGANVSSTSRTGAVLPAQRGVSMPTPRAAELDPVYLVV